MLHRYIHVADNEHFAMYLFSIDFMKTTNAQYNLCPWIVCPFYEKSDYTIWIIY